MSRLLSNSPIHSAITVAWPTRLASAMGRALLVAAACTVGAVTPLMQSSDAAAQFFGSAQDRKAGIAQEDAARMLSIAMGYMSEGKLLMARSQLEILIERYPTSSAADEARKALAPVRAAGTSRSEPEAKPGSLAEEPSRTPATAATPTEPHRAVASANVRALEAKFREATGDRVFFPPASAELGTKARSVLSAQAQWLKAHPNMQAVIEAHADEPGSSELNHEIAVQRGAAVKARLLEEGLSPDRVHVIVHGREAPVAKCSDSSCSAQNRRVVTRIEPGTQRVGTAGHTGSTPVGGANTVSFGTDRRN